MDLKTDQSLGPHCDRANIMVDDLLNMEPLKHPLAPDLVTNGLALELNRFSKRKQISDGVLCQWIMWISSDSNSSADDVLNLLEKLKTTRNDLRRKKKKIQVSELEKLPFSVSVSSTPSDHNVAPEPEPEPEPAPAPALEPKEQSKVLNSLKHEISKATKHLGRLKQKKLDVNQELITKKRTIGYYQPKNVKRRQETASKKIRLLRIENSLKANHLSAFRTEIKQKDSKICELQQNIQDIQKQLLKQRKMKSYYKQKSMSLKSEDHQRKTCNHAQYIKYLENQVELLAEAKERIITKEKGVFNEGVRQCVLDLTGFEVASEKVGGVIDCVGKHLFNYQFKKGELPNPSTVRNIVDEGQYISKSMIASELEATDGFGIMKDGTTRRKEKLLDTAITISNKKIYGLGITKVAHETGQTIADVTQNAINELSLIHGGHDLTKPIAEDNPFRSNLLQKLVFLMSDRAANEKKSNRLIVEWRDNILKQCTSDEDASLVHSFFCSAHVLLGFHSYCMEDLKSIVPMAIGRDGHPTFKNFRPSNAAERAVRMTSEVFGPVGDYLGLRDRWLGFCATNNVTSFIGNYRDNRFNSLFEGSAQVVSHRDHFISILKAVPEPNQKLQSVLADLSCPKVFTLLYGLAVMFLHVTGPYWKLVNSNIDYLDLHTVIQALKDNLVNFDSQKFIQEFEPFVSAFPPIEGVLYNSVKSHLIHPDIDVTFLAEVLTCVAASFVRTINKQLIDFLPGGVYGSSASLEEKQRTSFAHVTNLGCEHQFGMLDSSQRRRPNASIHYHSSVLLLKSSKKDLTGWMSKKTLQQRQLLWQNARKYGKHLRKVHREQEKVVGKELLDEIFNKKEKVKKAASGLIKRSKNLKKNTKIVNKIKKEKRKVTRVKKVIPSLNLPDDFKFLSPGIVVAVAFDNRWYPGVVEEVLSPELAKVSFLAPSKKPEEFFWPSVPDVTDVHASGVLQTGFEISPVCGGRRQKIDLSKDITILYEYQANK